MNPSSETEMDAATMRETKSSPSCPIHDHSPLTLTFLQVQYYIRDAVRWPANSMKQIKLQKINCECGDLILVPSNIINHSPID